MKWITAIFIACILIASIPLVSSLKQCGTDYCNDFVIKSGTQGTGTQYIMDMIINIGSTFEKKAHLYTKVGGVILTSGVAKGGSITTLYYDVLVDVQKERYKVDENVIADIIIINKGYIPDRDGRMSTYLIGPDGKKVKEQVAEFELISPTCGYGYRFDWYLDSCVDAVGNEQEPFKSVITRKVALPTDSTNGEWKFYVEYESRVQPNIKVWDSFDVYSRDYTIYILVIISLLAYYMGRRKPKEGRKW